MAAMPFTRILQEPLAINVFLWTKQKIGKVVERKMNKPTSAQLKGWKRLKQDKYRREEGAFLAEGEKVVGELLKSGRPVKAILVCPEIVRREMDTESVPLFELTRHQWEGLSQDKSPEGMMAVAQWPLEPSMQGNRAENGLIEITEGSGPLLMLYQVNNPGNLGALIRTAHWFGFGTVILSRNSCEATNPKVVRASMGSIFHLQILEGIDFDAFIPSLSGRFTIVGTDAHTGIAPHPCGKNTALLLGSESHGLPVRLQALANEKWKIPGAGRAESLSLPQAGAVMMYECVKLFY